jgi:dolichol-phosphate mannosyltransferase
MYNEQAVLGTLYERLTAAARSWGDDYEVIAVDDGSRDGTLAGLSEIHRRDPRWKVLSFSRNFGHQTAVSAGLHYASGDVAAVMDADLQDPPEELNKLLDQWRAGYHVVYAIRANRKEGVLKRAAYAGFYRLLRKLAAIDIPLDAGDFCLMDRAVVDVLASLPERTRFVRGLRCWAGFRQTGVVYDRPARAAGATKYSLGKLVRLAADGIFSFSSAPLKLSSWLGIGCCAASAVLIVALVVWWASNVPLLGMRPGAAVGWTSLFSLVLFLGGLQLLMIGFIGEYLARVFEETKGRPPWVIAGALGFDQSLPRAAVGWYVPDSRAQTRPIPARFAKAG